MQFRVALTELIELELGAIIFCGPGAFIISVVLYTRGQSLLLRNPDWTQQQLLARSAMMGIVSAFINLPGWLAIAIMPDDETFIVARVLILFAVAGASAGFWIGWQVWRASHPEAGFWPRFSLKTLMLVVYAWGVLLAIFAPR